MHTERLKQIRMLVLDVDGVMTDGSIILGNNGNETKQFNVKDGLGIKLVRQLGLVTAVITGKESALVARRCENLGIDAVYQNQPNKLEAFNSLLHHFHLEAAQVAYIGDDLPDLALIQRAGLGITPADAHYLVRQHSDLCLASYGGHGAVREFCDLLFQAHNLEAMLVEAYCSRGEAAIRVF